MTYQDAKCGGRPTVSILTVSYVVDTAYSIQCSTPSGRYVPSRCLGWGGWRARFKAARLVWSCKADALLWEAE